MSRQSRFCAVCYFWQCAQKYVESIAFFVCSLDQMAGIAQRASQLAFGVDRRLQIPSMP